MAVSACSELDAYGFSSNCVEKLISSKFKKQLEHFIEEVDLQPKVGWYVQRGRDKTETSLLLVNLSP